MTASRFHHLVPITASIAAENTGARSTNGSASSAATASVSTVDKGIEKSCSYFLLVIRLYAEAS